MHYISWETMSKPVEVGGLGFRRLRLTNEAFMIKLGWGLMTNSEALWAKVLLHHYMRNIERDDLLMPLNAGNQSSPIWKAICHLWPHVLEGVK